MREQLLITCILMSVIIAGFGCPEYNLYEEIKREPRLILPSTYPLY